MNTNKQTHDFFHLHWAALLVGVILFLPDEGWSIEDGNTHLVRKGDTLSEIARDHGCTVRALMEANKLKGSLIKVGETLRLPSSVVSAGKKESGGSGVQLIEVNDHQGFARIHKEVLAKGAAKSTEVWVDLSIQKAYLIMDGVVAIESPVSSGKKTTPSPRGLFHISEKQSKKTSTIFGTSMPYWMRLDDTAYGLHAGPLPGHAASHGCIRLPEKVAPILFAHTPAGTVVRIQSQVDLPTGNLAVK